MSVKFTPVQWNPNKYWYDAIMLAGVALFLWLFIHVVPSGLDHERPINPAIHNARAFGACAFVMLSVILSIGPLARLDRRFLPLLYNRRHFGVMTLFVAISHVGYILGWYYAFSPTPRWEAVFAANTSLTQVQGFPFELFGLFALITLMILAFTSHDFWMKFLTPRIWKRLHYLIYPAYAAVVAHVALGILQDQRDQTLTWVILGCALVVAGLHIAAAAVQLIKDDPKAPVQTEGWVAIGEVPEFREGFAKVARLPGGDRVAVFLQDGRLSAISNACAHQNGPLGEGKVIDCLVTCPWHGFQYDVRTGRSPAPFTETVPTYNLALKGTTVLVDPEANPPGTPVDPVEVPS
ncbi:MAG: Rieske 2Fe-2S domain-containing protein [Pseudomonadota bacterium]